MQPRELMRLFVRAAKAWSDDEAPTRGAAISYYTVFSLAPLLVIVIAVAGAVFGREAVQGEIVAQVSGLIGQQGAELVQSLVAASSEKDKGLVAGLISAVVLVIGATTVFAELQRVMDHVWDVPKSQQPQGIVATLRARLLSFGLILGLVFLLMASLVVSAGLAAFGKFTTGLLPGAEVLLQALGMAVSFAILTVLFAMIFKFMPSTRIEWRDVWVGAATTALLFEVGKFAIGLYLGKSSMTASFAAAGSLVVLIAWVYYAAQIFLFGAEFTKVYAQSHGSRVGAAASPAAVAAQASPTGPSAQGARDSPAPATRAAPALANAPAQRLELTAARLQSHRQAALAAAEARKARGPNLLARTVGSAPRSAGAVTLALVVLGGLGRYALRQRRRG